MSIFKAAGILLITIISNSITYASFISSVPFENVDLASRKSRNFNYDFGPHKLIFCFSNTLQTEGRITWIYKNKTQVKPLPIFLKTSANFQGDFADAKGQLSIYNNTSTTMIINCQFGF